MRTPPWLDGSVEQLETAVVIVAADRTIAYANSEAHRLFGTVPGRLAGVSMERLAVPERRGELRNIEDVLAGGAARRVRTVLGRDDGTRVSVTASYEPCFDAIGKVDRVAIRYEPVPAGRSLMPSFSPPRPSHPPLGMSVPPGPPGSSPPRVREQWSVPPPRNSEQRLSPMRVSDELEQRLRQLESQMKWLEERLSISSNVAPLDDPRERARALMVVTDAKKLVRESLTLVAAADEEIPAAPRVPRV